MMKKPHNKRRKGIALIELVIALGIVGIVTAAIWAASSTVRDNDAVSDTVHVIEDIASRVRAVYTGFPNAAAPVSIADQIARDLYPESVVNAAGDNTVTPWGGAYNITFKGGATVGVGFALEITMDTSVDKEKRRTACLGLLTRNPGSATTYTDGVSDTLPSATVAYDPTQGPGPALTFVNNGSWQHVTTADVLAVTTLIAGGSGCQGVALYYKL